MPEKDRKPRVVEPEVPVMVRAENVSKTFGKVRALDQISFQIRKGEVLGLLGPNGAGKTTAMRILSGYFPPTQGKVWMYGEELFKNPQKIKRHIGYLPERLHLYDDMRVGEYLDFVARIKGVPKRKRKRVLNDKLDRCGLIEVGHRLIGKLSKGYTQRVGLAQALLGEPDILLLDEPTSGLDPKQIKEIRTLIRELGRERTLILSTHILPEVSMVCDRVLIVNQGKVMASGTAEELGAGLQTSHEISITMAERHRRDEARDLLGSVEGVERISVTEEKGDRVTFSVFVSKELELRPEITRLFVHHHIPLLEIRSGRMSLEEIFLKLVVDEYGERDRT